MQLASETVRPRHRAPLAASNSVLESIEDRGERDDLHS
jgi:hypothetical protein